MRSFLRAGVRFPTHPGIALEGPGDDTYIVDDITDVVDESVNGGGIDTVLSSIASIKLGNAAMFKGDIENATAVEGSAAFELVGNGLNNVLRGNSADNQINGSGGDDTMIGGGGSDIYFLDTAGDIADERTGSGSDTVISPFTMDLANAVQFLGVIENMRLVDNLNSNAFGNALANFMRGNNGNNILDGRAENDTLDGELGNDTLIGGEGNDTLIGGTGLDSLTGGNGDDTYLNPGTDIIVEGSGPTSGTDTVQSDGTVTLAANVEILILTGAVAANGTGNAGANTMTGNDGANTLDGLEGNDTLTGGLGADTLRGGNGNDTYINPGADVIQEGGGVNSGTDTVQSDATLTLAPNIERLFLTGTNAISGTGNGLANLILGNDKANVLNGADGNDTLNAGGGSDTVNGGAGLDRLIGGLQRDKIIPGTDNVRDEVAFTLIGESTGQTRDVITGMDFNNEDKIDIPVVPTGFAAAIGVGALNLATFNQDLAAVFTAAALPVGKAALFNPSTGDQDVNGMVYLIVDANGVAGYQANQDWVFQLENHTGALDTTDFI